MSINLSTTETTLRSLAAERILLLDGGMGTMLQQRRFDEAAFRNTRFKDWQRDVRGNNDLLTLTQPDAVREIHLAYFQAGADIVSTNTFSSTVIAQADYGMESLVPELNRVCRATRARGGRTGAEARRPPALCRRRDRTDQPHRIAVARRQQSGLPRGQLRRPEGTLMPNRRGPCSKAASTSCWSRPFSTR